MAKNSAVFLAMGFNDTAISMSNGGTMGKSSQEQRGKKSPSNSASEEHRDPPRTRNKSASEAAAAAAGAASASGASAQQEKPQLISSRRASSSTDHQDRCRIKQRAQHDGAEISLNSDKRYGLGIRSTASVGGQQQCQPYPHWRLIGMTRRAVTQDISHQTVHV